MILGDPEQYCLGTLYFCDSSGGGGGGTPVSHSGSVHELFRLYMELFCFLSGGTFATDPGNIAFFL